MLSSSLDGRSLLCAPRGPDVITGSWTADREQKEKTRDEAVWEGHEPPPWL